MKIRKRITLWISGTALLSTIVFSAIIFFELTQEPFKFIDKEIKHMAEALVDRMALQGEKPPPYDLSQLPYHPDLYWIKVTDTQKNTLYSSRITRYTDIPPSRNKTSYMVERSIPKSQIRLGQDDHGDVMFRVMVIETRLNGLPVSVQIAKPIEDLEEEILELLQNIAVSLTLCTLIIIVLSYNLAGKILKPVVDITRTAKKISETSLDKRIPLEPNKDEMYELATALNKMFDRLQYSFKRQREFIGNASHELKSPITLLMLAQEEMLMNDNLPPSTSDSLMRQLATTRRMSHLVKNLLDLSRLEQQETLTRKQVDLTALANRVFEDYKEMLAAKNICTRINLEKDLLIQGDPEKLFRLLINLVDNAIRYNLEAKGTIIATGRQTNGNIQLEVSNTGRAIPCEDLELVFEQFYRVEKSRSLTHGGSGLGLAIAKKIVDLHDGTIAITNEPDGLIRATIVLPVFAGPRAGP
ncbi:signal transduction histidine kinase [Desulforapulum autotrophicum HRM2]|uniref:histidine kinase n=1 Tax=Desulforapulum autotrophicum (strain ATCC 43914 / DSM 3382 / VKM B-1955 / HRM2) TaxID=177437 RepID=C0QL68_DESAH|nr:HAMP domain-containing sensor histidine kinase [Desulforapulum autotrophicum]ACN14154.1 signal transduction histidine kinase [Desulforapulum autotrophicum HRM2]